MASPETNRLFRIRCTVMQMLRDRGYLVADADINLSLPDFVERYGDPVRRDDLFIARARKDDPIDRIYVQFPRKAKCGISTIRTFCQRMRDDGVKRGVLVVREPFSAFAQQLMQEICNVFDLEVFQEVELVVNVKDHVLVPYHQMLTEDEKATLMHRYNVKESQLPGIKITDPIARYYGVKRGQVVKIIRTSESAGRYVTYRIAV